MVAESTRPVGGCLAKHVGLLTLGPRTGAVRQALAVGGQPQAFPWWLAKPGRTRREPPRPWPGPSVVRPVEVEERAGQGRLEPLRLLGVHSRQVAQPAATADPAAHAKEVERVTDHRQRVAARGCAWAAAAAAARAADAGRGPGRRSRQPRPWRSHALPSRVAAVSSLTKRARRGRPPQAEAPQVAGR